MALTKELLSLLSDGGALGDEAEDVKLDVGRVGRDRDEVAAVGARGQRVDILFEAGDGDGARRLEHGARVLKGVAHGGADLVVRHDDDVVDELVAQPEDLAPQLPHRRAVDKVRRLLGLHTMA